MEGPSAGGHSAPELVSESNVTVCVHGGVATVSIPQRGGSKTPQRQAYETGREDVVLVFRSGSRA
jgi:hypothetical protein